MVSIIIFYCFNPGNVPQISEIVKLKVPLTFILRLETRGHIWNQRILPVN